MFQIETIHQVLKDNHLSAATDTIDLQCFSSTWDYRTDFFKSPLYCKLTMPGIISLINLFLHPQMYIILVWGRLELHPLLQVCSH